MSEITKGSAYVLLCLFHLWNSHLILVDAESKDNAIAKVTAARNDQESIWMKVVPDNKTDSGWAVDALRNVPSNHIDNYYLVYMYGIERRRPRFRHFIYKNNLCPLVSKKSRHPKPPFEHFLPTQIMKMIFPGRQGGCKFSKGKKAIKTGEKVNADRKDPQNEDLGLPYTLPFDLMVSIVRVSEDYDPVNKFEFQVNFTVSSGNDKVSDVVKTVTDTDVPLKVPACVIDVKNGKENDYFTAVENKTSPSGWDIKVVDRLPRWKIEINMFFDLWAVEPPGSKSNRHIFHAYLCDLLVHNSRFNGYPDQNYLPRQIANMMFPGYKSQCDFDKTNYTIVSKGTVDLNPFDNPDVQLPHSPYYNLIATVRSKKYMNESMDMNSFQVTFTIGDPLDTINGISEKECKDKKNEKNAVVQQACKGLKLIQTGATKAGEKISSSLTSPISL